MKRKILVNTKYLKVEYNEKKYCLKLSKVEEWYGLILFGIKTSFVKIIDKGEIFIDIEPEKEKLIKNFINFMGNLKKTPLERRNKKISNEDIDEIVKTFFFVSIGVEDISKYYLLTNKFALFS